MKGLVLAGNYQQFLDWCQLNNEQPRDWFYPANPDNPLGTQGLTIIKHGTYWENPLFEGQWKRPSKKKVRGLKQGSTIMGQND